jgi:hypothetical protein
VDDNGAFESGADTRGHTVGELHDGSFTLCAGVMTIPKVAHGFDLRLNRARGENPEVEARSILADAGGAGAGLSQRRRHGDKRR